MSIYVCLGDTFKLKLIPSLITGFPRGTQTPNLGSVDAHAWRALMGIDWHFISSCFVDARSGWLARLPGKCVCTYTCAHTRTHNSHSESVRALLPCCVYLCFKIHKFKTQLWMEWNKESQNKRYKIQYKKGKRVRIDSLINTHTHIDCTAMLWMIWMCASLCVPPGACVLGGVSEHPVHPGVWWVPTRHVLWNPKAVDPFRLHLYPVVALLFLLGTERDHISFGVAS